MTDTNRQIEAMKKLGMSETEIAEVLEADKRIDQGEKLFELSAEQEREAKKARNVGRAPTAYKFTKRERKPDHDKADLLNVLFSAVLPVCDTYEITNGEREGPAIIPHSGAIVNRQNKQKLSGIFVENPT